MIRWYLCPLEFVDVRNSWTPKIRRYQRTNIAWIEVPNRRVLVKADVDDVQHAEILTDPEIMDIPSDAVVPAGRRAGIRSALVNLGFTAQEINDTGFNRDTLLRKIASERSQIRGTGRRGEVEIVAQRIPATTPFEHLNRKVPG